MMFCFCNIESEMPLLFQFLWYLELVIDYSFVCFFWLFFGFFWLFLAFFWFPWSVVVNFSFFFSFFFFFFFGGEGGIISELIIWKIRRGYL